MEEMRIETCPAHLLFRALREATAS